MPRPGAGRALRGGKLEHRRGRGAPRDPAGRQLASELDHPRSLVEEEQVERESHSEGVDAATPRDQQALAGVLAAEQREPEQPAAAGRRNRDRSTEDLGRLEAAEAERRRHSSG